MINLKLLLLYNSYRWLKHVPPFINWSKWNYPNVNYKCKTKPFCFHANQCLACLSFALTLQSQLPVAYCYLLFLLPSGLDICISGNKHRSDSTADNWLCVLLQQPWHCILGCQDYLSHRTHYLQLKLRVHQSVLGLHIMHQAETCHQKKLLLEYSILINHFAPIWCSVLCEIALN